MSFSVSMLFLCLVIFLIFSAPPKVSARERLDRGVVALPRSDGEVYLSWRLLTSDPEEIAFNVYRSESADGGYVLLNNAPITDSTNYLDKTTSPGQTYYYIVKSVVYGKEVGFSRSVEVMANQDGQSYIKIPLQGEYSAQKVAIADLDGDGMLEYVIKQPNFNTDPYQHPGYWKKSEDTYKIEAYRQDGTFMWRYDMGWAIEEGIWYSPIVVYDLDGDGKAEVYTKAGEGDPRDPDGRVTSGPEYLVKLDGTTGEVVEKMDWLSRDGIDDYNYSSRNMLAVAYLDGRNPSLIMLRGTYTLIKISALDGNLKQKWYWESSGEHKDYSSQGLHGLHGADIDGDGRDELVIGGAAIDSEGKPMWNLKEGHPDIAYVANIDPDRPGLEIFYGFERRHEKNAICLVDAKTGERLWTYDGPTTHVHGQGMVADIDPSRPGMECYAGESNGSKHWLYDAKGDLISDERLGSLAPKTAYWDDDQQKEIVLDRKIGKYKGESYDKIEGRILAIADCLGDWREEIITSLEGELRIYSTRLPAKTRRTSLMQDRQYRLGVAEGAMGYYYPPQLGGNRVPESINTGKIKVGACQMLTTEDVGKSAEKMIEKLREAAEQGIQILSFPEGTLFGYCCRTDYWESAQLEWFQEAEARISAVCKENNIATIVGSAHKEDGRWVNSLAIFDRDGTLKARYGKTFLAGEKWCINNRGPLPVVSLAGVDCSFIICHDVRYPELVRLPAAMGAQICFFCSCESGLTAEYKLSAYRAMPISRATENGIYLVMANTPADKEDIRRPGSSHGNSKIVHPDGNVLVESGFFTEEIVTATLDLSKASGGVARRTIREETILREWLQAGLKFVVRVP
ncbi:nitrilase-related carbon-nitrogen hydrolase [Candidatus Poribacteria bacterium]